MPPEVEAQLSRNGLHIKQLVPPFRDGQQMQLKQLLDGHFEDSSDPRCSRLYDRLLANQSQWSRQFPPAVEHACAATVVEANSSDLTAQTTSFEPVSRRKRILNIIAEIDTESQLARLRQLAVPMVGMDRCHALRPLLAPPYPWFG